MVQKDLYYFVRSSKKDPAGCLNPIVERGLDWSNPTKQAHYYQCISVFGVV